MASRTSGNSRSNHLASFALVAALLGVLTVPVAVALSRQTGRVHLLDAAWSIFEGKAEARGIVMVRRYGAVPDILGSASEMQQVFLNLISNAIDAMPKGGQLTLVVEPAMSTEAPGAWVRVGDTGAGLAPEARSRLFEPFFTTKTDVGTGLGLWIVQQIVTEHRGRIEAGSEAASGGGAVFSIFLPAAEALAA